MALSEGERVSGHGSLSDDGQASSSRRSGALLHGHPPALHCARRVSIGIALGMWPQRHAYFWELPGSVAVAACAHERSCACCR